MGEPGSLPRNPKLAAALYDTRFAETKGSGVRAMREMCEQAGLAPPLFESHRSNDGFVVRLFFHHFLGPEDLAWLGRFKARVLCSLTCCIQIDTVVACTPSAKLKSSSLG